MFLCFQKTWRTQTLWTQLVVTVIRVLEQVEVSQLKFSPVSPAGRPKLRYTRFFS